MAKAKLENGKQHGIGSRNYTESGWDVVGTPLLGSVKLQTMPCEDSVLNIIA